MTLSVACFFSGYAHLLTISKTFKLFDKLPTEIRLTVWELALPHRRLLRIKAPKKLTRGKVTNSPYGFVDLKTGRNLGIPKYVLDFGTTDENIGMLKACWESRLVTVKTFSVHLPAQNPKKEIWVGPDDLVVLDKWERILKSLHEVRNPAVLIRKEHNY